MSHKDLWGTTLNHYAINEGKSIFKENRLLIIDFDSFSRIVNRYRTLQKIYIITLKALPTFDRLNLFFDLRIKI
jgi:hypothetical protein